MYSSVDPHHRPSDAGRVGPGNLDRQRDIPTVGLLMVIHVVPNPTL
jgi:hypothetical protein